MKASELFVKALENENVKYVFGLPGEENIDVMDAFLDSNIQFIQTRHEQGAAFMADVYGRLTGKAGVCLSTLGPGATNLITGIADANMDHAPVVAITGQAGLMRMHKESHQYLDLVELFKPITKWNTQIKRPEVIPEIVRKAFKIAQTEKRGATHIDFPEDVAKESVESELLRPQFPYPTEPSLRQIERAAKIVSEAKYPIIIAGNGVIRNQASDALVRFAEKLNIPVTNTFMAKGVISYSHPLSLFTVGLQSKDYVSCGLDRADVVIAVGYDQVEFDPSRWNHERTKKIIHIDTAPAEVDAAYVVEVGVLGNIGSSLDLIAERAKPKDSNYSTTLREIILKEIEEYADDTGFPVKPQKILSDLRSVLGEEDIVISDVGAHKMWIARMYPAYKPNTCIISNGFASMGIALPGAIAAKLLYPEKKVVAVCGDGGFLMNLQELETAVRLKTPFVSLIMNDNGYGLIQWKQMIHFKREAYVNLGNPDFVTLAKSFGAAGYKVNKTEELLPILKEALEQKVPAIIDCPVDYRENLNLTDKLGKITCPI